MDEPLTGDSTGQALRPLRWGLGDFLWIYFAGLVASAITGSIGYAISGDPVGHPGALTIGLAAGGLYGAWAAGLVYASHAKGLGSLAADFGLVVHSRRLWALLLGVLLQFVLGAMVYPLVSLAGNEKQQVVNDLRGATGAKLFVLFVIAGLAAPVLEELLFRGLLLRALRRRLEPVPAVAISALLFAAAHVLGDASLGVVAIIPALFALGVVSGVAAVRVGDLSVSIPLHMGFNVVTLALSALLLR